MTEQEMPMIDSPAIKYEWAEGGEYILPARCWNCGEQARVRYARGYRASPVECSNCGCNELRPIRKEPT